MEISPQKAVASLLIHIESGAAGYQDITWKSESVVNTLKITFPSQILMYFVKDHKLGRLAFVGNYRRWMFGPYSPKFHVIPVEVVVRFAFVQQHFGERCLPALPGSGDKGHLVITKTQFSYGVFQIPFFHSDFFKV